MSKVAIITRTKNRPLLLKRALRSVLAQTFTNWHHVVVNDGGDSRPVDELCAEEADRYGNRLTIVHQEESRGMEAASNAGMRASTSDYAVIHDDDDTWKPTFLEECIALLESPRLPRSVRGVVTHTERILEAIEGDTVRQLSTEPFNTWLRAVTLFRVAANNPFPPISFVFSRAAYDEVGRFREDLPVLGDWDFHLRFIARFDIAVIPKMLANYHHRPSLMSGDYSNTVFGGDHLHALYDAQLRNDLLRQDLAENRVGLGHLVNIAASFESVLLNVGSIKYLPGPLTHLRNRVNNVARAAHTIAMRVIKPTP
jgi:glycosyltransferase involved in cell wall biosynthesis